MLIIIMGITACIHVVTLKLFPEIGMLLIPIFIYFNFEPFIELATKQIKVTHFRLHVLHIQF